jgi:hypothetical protein
MRRLAILVCATLAIACFRSDAAEEKAQKLQQYFTDYYTKSTFKQQGLLDSLKDIGKLFSTPAVQTFKWSAQFKYEDLVRFNDLLNVELEKEGYHAYLVESTGGKAQLLRCLLGKMKIKEAARQFTVAGRSVKLDVIVLSDILVGAEPALRFNPSFFSDRGRVYGILDMWRSKYAEVVWRYFDDWKTQGIDPAKDINLDKVLPTKDPRATMKQLAYVGWRPIYLEATAKDNPQQTFALACADAMMRAVFWEEVTHGMLNQKAFKLTNADESIPQLASIAYSDQPMAALSEIYAYAKYGPESPYRKAYDSITLPLAREIRGRVMTDKKVAALFGDKLPAKDDELAFELYRADKESLQKAAANVLKAKLEGGPGK